VARPLPRGSDFGHRLTSLPRTETQLDVPSWRSRPSHGHLPTRHPHQPRAPRPISKHDSPGWGPPPQGVRQDRATLPQYLAPGRHTSPSRQEPVRAPRGKDHGKPLAAPVGGEGSRGNTLLPSARGSMGFDSPGQLTTPSHPEPRHQHQHLLIGMPYGRKFDQPPRQHGGVASELATKEEDLRLRYPTSPTKDTLPCSWEGRGP
jgi:hypothetical protein